MIPTTTELVKKYLKTIVTDGWLCNIGMEGFDTYYDMSGQRTCKLIKTFDHSDLETYPLILGLTRADYFCFYQEQGEKAKLFSGGTERTFYRDDLKAPVYLGQVTITEEMLKNVTITIQDKHVIIKFRSFELRASKDPRTHDENTN